MRSRDVVGRRIVRVEHKRWYNEHLGEHTVDCIRLHLDDGTHIYASATETLDAPTAQMHHHKPGRAA